jgi:hypothetical protein
VVTSSLFGFNVEKASIIPRIDTIMPIIKGVSVKALIFTVM